ncbi:hypothetical protein T02_997 [Trichinella nativa]|uniref:Uncharacterized protein n=1 Tax=Trichinella nativa TaxID=6335 RepID=A0A0V1L1V7_9BILA|nr:hypothetical protein T02_997 [Trichinella nativa]KRZ87026.1 hypothetical protein T08_14429 [Trichinella sp. T8]
MAMRIRKRPLEMGQCGGPERNQNCAVYRGSHHSVNYLGCLPFEMDSCRQDVPSFLDPCRNGAYDLKIDNNHLAQFYN